jgi:hypothetical protein
VILVTVSNNNNPDPKRGGDPTSIRRTNDSTGLIFSSKPETRQELRKELENFLIRNPKKRQDGIWPYLLIRAYPNDHGVRLPPANPFWESPDIIVVPGQVTTFDPNLITLRPAPNMQHTIFVRVWNLGRLPAYGVRLRVYWANPSFSFNDPTGPGSPHFIGGTYINLSSRYQPGSHNIFRIPVPWIPELVNNGHECLLAKVDCFADLTGPGFDANIDRHVGQRNLFLATLQEDLTPLLDSLGRSIETNGVIRLVYGTEYTDTILVETSRGLRADSLSKIIRTQLNISDMRTKTLFSMLDTTHLRIQAVKGRNILGGYTILSKL